MSSETRPALRIWQLLFAGLFLLAYTAILTIDLVFHSLSYQRKKTFLLENWQLLLVGLVLLLICSAIILLVRTGEDEKKAARRSTRTLLILSAVLFVLQAVVFFFSFFVTDWDAGGKMLTNVLRLANGAAADLDNLYYSHYPNNIFLSWFFALVVRFGQILGFDTRVQSAYFLTLLQCLLNVLTGLLVFRVIHVQTGSRRAAWLGWTFFLLLIGTSCWTMIPYSDGMSLILPVLMLRLYQMLENGRLLWLKWTGICLLAYWGYQVKPQVIIMFIAIMGISALRRLAHAEGWKKSLMTCAGSLVIVALVFGASSFGMQKITDSTGLVLDPEERLSAAHFFMMGLHPEFHGVWAMDDVEFSEDIHSNAERDAADLERAMDRIRNYTPATFADHLIKKTMIIFNDGSFCWGGEGKFFSEITEPKDVFFSNLFRSIIYTRDVEGKYYKYYLTMEQTAWLTLLLLCLTICLARKDRTVLVMILSILGLTAFELLFEARARYLYLYVPVYICIAATGWDAVCRKIHRSK